MLDCDVLDNSVGWLSQNSHRIRQCTFEVASEATCKINPPELASHMASDIASHISSDMASDMASDMTSYMASDMDYERVANVAPKRLQVASNEMYEVASKKASESFWGII